MIKKSKSIVQDVLAVAIDVKSPNLAAKKVKDFNKTSETPLIKLN